jgi:Ca2+-binding RTX toxin-like protein
VTATATADATGAWSYTPVGLHDGQHTIVASETNAAGLIGTASLAFTLDTTPPAVTETLASSGAPALIGTGDPNATVHFTVDGSVVAATATATASGAWSFAPIDLATGPHTVVASETDLAGNTGAASDSFTLGPPVPTFTGDVIGNGEVTLTGTTGHANDQVTIYDGNTWLGSATTASNGNFTFAASANPAAVNDYGAYATDPSGSIWHGINQVIVGGTAAATLTGTAGDDIVNANGGNDTILGGPADLLTGGSGKVTFAYNAASGSTPSAPDTITDFKHGVDKIDFTNIAGITASSGAPLFQGNITGTSNLTLNPHSVAYVEVGTNTDILVNTTGAAETVTATNLHAANMEIVLQGVHLGLTATDFHHA